MLLTKDQNATKHVPYVRSLVGLFVFRKVMVLLVVVVVVMVGVVIAVVGLMW